MSVYICLRTFHLLGRWGYTFAMFLSDSSLEYVRPKSGLLSLHPEFSCLFRGKVVRYLRSVLETEILTR